MATETALDTNESARLETLESVIDSGRKAFVEVGRALLEIKTGKLYRSKFGTFEEYCQNKWQMERRTAYRYLDAASVIENVSHGTQTQPILPSNERQTRPLSSLPSSEQKPAWDEAVETAPKDIDGNPKITAAHVEKVVAKRVQDAPAEDKAAPDSETKSDPWLGYNADTAKLVPMIQECQAIISRMHSEVFGAWIDLKGHDRILGDMRAHFTNHVIARWATQQETAKQPDKRNFVYAFEDAIQQKRNKRKLR